MFPPDRLDLRYRELNWKRDERPLFIEPASAWKNMFFIICLWKTMKYFVRALLLEES